MREFLIYQDDSGTWLAQCRELPGYTAKGSTKEEALEKMKSALLIFYPCKCENEN